MTKLEKIERDIAAPSPDELASLRQWFERHEADAFDRRIAQDAMIGRLDALADATFVDHRVGRT